jgi:hypothetical protein
MYLEELRKVTRNLSQNSWHPNWILCKYESDALSLKLPVSYGLFPQELKRRTFAAKQLLCIPE